MSEAYDVTPSNANAYLVDRPWDFWLARAAVIVVVALQSAVVNDLSLGPSWLAPALELAPLLPLSVATAWTQKKARHAETDEEWVRVERVRGCVRALAIGLTAIVTLMNFAALARLIAAIVMGHAGTGRTLLLDAINIWVTNVVIFGLWYWSIDSGGSAAGGPGAKREADFFFTQQQRLRARAAGLHRLSFSFFYERAPPFLPFRSRPGRRS